MKGAVCPALWMSADGRAIGQFIYSVLITATHWYDSKTKEKLPEGMTRTSDGDEIVPEKVDQPLLPKFRSQDCDFLIREAILRWY
jgi:hypothetical protein